ncbi:MAG: acetylxylan esterase [Kiritimatiellae bacterium]|nr:acetylxylan esterase [Kiritimatiellia bacterium]
MKSIISIIAAACSAAAFAAGELDDAQLIGTTDKERAIDYEAGETMTFTLALKRANPFPAGTYFIKWTRTGDDGLKDEGKVELSAEKPLVVKTSIAKPGFVRLLAVVVDAAGKPYRKQLHVDPNTPEGKRALNRWERADKRVFFDGGAAVHPETLQSVPEPADFDEFWARRRARLAKVPLKADVLELKGRKSGFRTCAVSIMCAGPRPSTGYLSIPEGKGRLPIRVFFHGYGHTYPNKGHVVAPVYNNDAICFNFSPHGYELEREPEYYDEFFRSICSGGRTFGFDDKQNEDPENSYFSGYTYRIMRALEWLKTLPEWDGRNLCVSGGSMGGLQSTWAAGLDKDVTEARPSIPWCCDIGGRDTLKRIIDPWYIHEKPALRYYDPVNLAKRVSRNCKFTIVRAGLGDYCCPPSGVAILFNNLKCDKTVNWVQGSTHGHVPPEGLGNQRFTLHEDALR